MRILITILAFVWFLGWGFWFLYERGHIDLSSSSTVNPTQEEFRDSVNTEIEEVITTSILTHHPPQSAIDHLIDSLMEVRKPHEVIQVVSYYDQAEPYTGQNENIG